MDGELAQADVIAVIDFLFNSAPLRCLDAADADDSGGSFPGLPDALRIIAAIYGTGVIPQPFPEPGPDPTDDGMDCEDPTIVPPAFHEALFNFVTEIPDCSGDGLEILRLAASYVDLTGSRVPLDFVPGPTGGLDDASVFRILADIKVGAPLTDSTVDLMMPVLSGTASDSCQNGDADRWHLDSRVLYPRHAHDLLRGARRCQRRPGS